LADRYYSADYDFDLQVIDISDPSSPTLIGSCKTSGYANDVCVSGNYAYMVAGQGLQIIDISNPSSPVLVGSCDTPGRACDIHVSGNYAYVADERCGLQIIDISNPISPILAGYYNTPGWASEVYVFENYAYLADGSYGLQVIDISDPASPTFVGNYDTPGWDSGIYVFGNYAYVGNEWAGFFILSFDGANNTPVGTDVEVILDPDVKVAFSEVTTAGNTSLTVSETNPGSEVSGFKFLNTYYDIVTTATYTGPITISITYDDSGLSAGREKNLKIFHWDGTDWVDATLSLDTINNVIIAEVPSLSWFGIAYDIALPEITIDSPIDGEIYTLNGTVLADWSATDTESGVAEATGTVVSGEAIDTSTVGEKIFTVTATDNAGNVVEKTVTYQVVYNKTVFLSPIKSDGSSAFKAGSTVPAKFQLTDANGNYVSDAVVNFKYQLEGEEELIEGVAKNADGSLFRYCIEKNRYIFNWSTKGLSPGIYNIYAVLDDGTQIVGRLKLK